MVSIEIETNSTHVMGIHVTISCQYCIAFEVMLLFLVINVKPSNIIVAFCAFNNEVRTACEKPTIQQKPEWFDFGYQLTQTILKYWLLTSLAVIPSVTPGGSQTESGNP